MFSLVLVIVQSPHSRENTSHSPAENKMQASGTNTTWGCCGRHYCGICRSLRPLLYFCKPVFHIILQGMQPQTLFRILQSITKASCLRLQKSYQKLQHSCPWTISDFAAHSYSQSHMQEAAHRIIPTSSPVFPESLPETRTLNTALKVGILGRRRGVTGG